MQTELNAQTTRVPIKIVGLNEVGLESGNDAFTSNRMLPWLQDQPSVRAWALWNVAYRDVILVDTRGWYSNVFNLTLNDLSSPTSYNLLRTMLTDLAARG